jgi:hypothetical protein
MFFSEHATHSDDQASRRDGAALLTQPTSYHLHWPGFSGKDSCKLRQFAKPLRGPDLGKPDKKVCKYGGPEHEHANVPAEVEGKTGAKHEQHQAQERFSLFPPADKQTSPKGHKYPGCDRTKDLAKVQNAAADHSGGNGGVHTQFTVVALKSAPLGVVNSNQWL